MDHGCRVTGKKQAQKHGDVLQSNLARLVHTVWARCPREPTVALHKLPRPLQPALTVKEAL